MKINNNFCNRNFVPSEEKALKFAGALLAHLLALVIRITYARAGWLQASINIVYLDIRCLLVVTQL